MDSTCSSMRGPVVETGSTSKAFCTALAALRAAHTQNGWPRDEARKACAVGRYHAGRAWSEYFRWADDLRSDPLDYMW